MTTRPPSRHKPHPPEGSEKKPPPPISPATLDENRVARTARPEPNVEGGLPVEAEELGASFMRNATEQDNYESQVDPDLDEGDPGVPLGQLISQASLGAARQHRKVVPVSSALSDETADVASEPSERDVDITADAVRLGSLFDQPIDERELSDEEAAELDATLGEDELLVPEVDADDLGTPNEERDREIARERERRRELRLRQTRPGNRH